MTIVDPQLARMAAASDKIADVLMDLGKAEGLSLGELLTCALIVVESIAEAGTHGEVTAEGLWKAGRILELLREEAAR